MAIDAAGPLPLVAMECQINYATYGTPGSGGMDRGRLLGAMDGELTAALRHRDPVRRQEELLRRRRHGSGQPSPWPPTSSGAPHASRPLKTSGERLERTATVQLFAYQEAGEL